MKNIICLLLVCLLFTGCTSKSKNETWYLVNGARNYDELKEQMFKTQNDFLNMDEEIKKSYEKQNIVPEINDSYTILIINGSSIEYTTYSAQIDKYGNYTKNGETTYKGTIKGSTILYKEEIIDGKSNTIRKEVSYSKEDSDTIKIDGTYFIK